MLADYSLRTRRSLSQAVRLLIVPIAVLMSNAPAFALSDDERREQERKEEARKEEQRKEEARKEEQRKEAARREEQRKEEARREEQRKEEARREHQREEQRKEEARREQVKQEQAAQDATKVENAKRVREEEEKRKEAERKASIGKSDGTYSEIVSSREVTKWTSLCASHRGIFLEEVTKYTTYSSGQRASSSTRTVETLRNCEKEELHEPEP